MNQKMVGKNIKAPVKFVPVVPIETDVANQKMVKPA